MLCDTNLHNIINANKLYKEILSDSNLYEVILS